MSCNLIARKAYRLYDVSELLDEHGHYGLGAFADNAFNEVVDEEELVSLSVGRCSVRSK